MEFKTAPEQGERVREFNGEKNGGSRRRRLRRDARKRVSARRATRTDFALFGVRFDRNVVRHGAFDVDRQAALFRIRVFRRNVVDGAEHRRGRFAGRGFSFDVAEAHRFGQVDFIRAFRDAVARFERAHLEGSVVFDRTFADDFIVGEVDRALRQRGTVRERNFAGNLGLAATGRDDRDGEEERAKG